MDEIQLKLNENGRGAFVIEKGEERLAEMQIGVKNGTMTVYHTEVSDALKGQGIGSKLLSAMVDYARANHLRVVPLCPFVHGQFKRHPDLYKDIWEKNE